MASCLYRVMKLITWTVIAVLLFVGTEGNASNQMCSSLSEAEQKRELCSLKGKIKSLQSIIEEIAQDQEHMKPLTTTEGCTADAPMNGVVKPVVVKLEHKASVRYLCDEQYKLYGDDIRQCDSGRLLGSKPTCKPLVSPLCPVQYIPYKSGTFEYKVCNVCEKWQRAREICQDDGGDLLTIDNDEQFEFFSNLVLENVDCITLPNNQVWIGGSDIEEDGHWRWIDGRTLPRKSPYWHKNVPQIISPLTDCLKRNCAKRGSNLCRLDDGYCFDLFPFICRRNITVS